MKTILFSIAIIIIVVITSCEKDAKNVTPPEFVSKVVVSAFISPGNDSSVIKLNNNVPAFGRSDDVSYIDSATVLISDGQVSVALINTNEGNYYFTREMFPIDYGKSYHLTISTRKGLTGEASCTVPSLHHWDTAIDTMKVISQGPNPVENFNYSFRFRDIPGEKNYYRILAYYCEYFNTSNTQNRRIYVKDDLQTDWGKDGKEIEVKTFETVGSYHPTNEVDSAFICFFLLNVDYDYYTFHKTIRNYAGGEDPFTEVAPVYSNIKGGLGIFCSYAQQVTSLRVK